MISFQTGTKVPRWARSTNSSKVVNRIAGSPEESLGQRGWRGRARHVSAVGGRARPAVCEIALRGTAHHVWIGQAAGPQLKLLLCLGHEHVEPAERSTTCRGRLAQQSCHGRVV